MGKYFLLLISLVLFSCVYHDLTKKIVIEAPTAVCDTLNVSWQKDILPIMTVSCATRRCHDGIERRNYLDYNRVKPDAATIKSKTQDRSMPFEGPALTQNQIDMIGCWVNNGALNN